MQLVFLKNHCYDQVLAKTNSSLRKKTANVFAKVFAENIVKTHNIGP
jgi:hypothetical protein